MPDAFAGEDRTLGVEVERAGLGREHLARPVRREGDVVRRGELRHALAAPADNVRDHNVLAEMELRLVEDPPPSRPVPPAVERQAEHDVEVRLRERRDRPPLPAALSRALPARARTRPAAKRDRMSVREYAPSRARTTTRRRRPRGGRRHPDRGAGCTRPRRRRGSQSRTGRAREREHASMMRRSSAGRYDAVPRAPCPEGYGVAWTEEPPGK